MYSIILSDFYVMFLSFGGVNISWFKGQDEAYTF